MKVPFKSSRRQWVKLWVNEWLQGTIRFQLTAEQRSLWADLLAMAGASRVPGVICSGETNGVHDAYPPDYLSNLLRWKEKPLREALKLFEAQDRISTKRGVIYIKNWAKYQSEYQRQAQYRKKVTTDNTPTLLVEGEEEGDKREREINTPSSFEVFWDSYPKKVAKIEAKRSWIKTLCDNHLGEILAAIESWKKTDQWRNPQYIPNPSTFLNQKRWQDEVPQNADREQATPTTERQKRSGKAIQSVLGSFEKSAGDGVGPVPDRNNTAASPSLPGSTGRPSPSKT